MKTLAVYHSKGGVGKTTTTVNLAYLAAEAGLRTLICDLDPQSSATFYFRVKPKFKSGVRGFIQGGRHLEKNIKGTDYDNLDLLPADITFRKLDVEINAANKSRSRLTRTLDSLESAYDYIFLDCPPTMTKVAENIFRAADHIIVPLIPTTLSLRSYSQVVKFLEKKGYDAKKLITFFSMVEIRKSMHKKIMDQVSREYPRVLKTYIPYLSDIERMGLHLQPVPVYAGRSAAAEAYRRLWHELTENLPDMT